MRSNVTYPSKRQSSGRLPCICAQAQFSCHSRFRTHSPMLFSELVAQLLQDSSIKTVTERFFFCSVCDPLQMLHGWCNGFRAEREVIFLFLVSFQENAFADKELRRNISLWRRARWISTHPEHGAFKLFLPWLLVSVKRLQIQRINLNVAGPEPSLANN